jgi:threonyl-tRNA synthetase
MERALARVDFDAVRSNCARLKAELGDFRVEVDERTESIGRKIREAELRKIPFMLVVGDREVEERTASVRRHKEGDQGALAVAELKAKLAE